MIFNKKNTIPNLQKKLSEERPGIKAQKLMMPEGRIISPKHNVNPIQSAVLLAIYVDNNSLKFPLIRRPIYNGSHSGQMALPGGKFEKSDIDLTNTALRESYEEIGIKPADVEVLGSLTNLYIPVTNMHVKPIVGFLNKTPNFKIDKNEVDKLFTIHINDLIKPAYKTKETWDLKGNNVEVPFYNLQKQKVWGATAMILSEFEQIIKGLV